jgi:hypothetical protein
MLRRLGNVTTKTEFGLQDRQPASLVSHISHRHHVQLLTIRPTHYKYLPGRSS